MEGSNSKLQDINGIPLLKWYLPNKKGTDEAENTEEIENVQNELLPEMSSSNVENTSEVMFCNNLPTETEQEISECNINSILQSSEIGDSSMNNFVGETSSMSYNLRERSNKKNDSKQNLVTNSRASPYIERRGRKRKIPNESSFNKISLKPAKKSVFNELQTSSLNKTPLMKKIKLDLIEKELLLKKVQKTLLKWMNSECSPLERNEALSLLENVKTIQADLSLIRGKLKFEKFIENRNILKKGIDELTSLANKINKELIDIIVECDIQHERLTEEINDINSIFPKILSINQLTLDEYHKKPQQNFNNALQNPSELHDDNSSHQMSKEINKNQAEIIISNNESQPIKQYVFPIESQNANSLILNCKQEKINSKVCAEKEIKKNRQRNYRKPEKLIVKKPKRLLKSEFNQTLKSLAKLTLTSQINESQVNKAVHSKNLSSNIITNVSQDEICLVGENLTEEIEDFSINCGANNSFITEVTDTSQTQSVETNSSINCYQNKRNEMNENQTLKTYNQVSDLCKPLPFQEKLIENDKLKPSVHKSVVNETLHFSNENPEENTLQTCKQNSALNETLNTQKVPFVHDSFNVNSLKKPTVPIIANFNQNSFLPTKLKTVKLILHENSKSLIYNNQINYGNCKIKIMPIKSQTNTMINCKESKIICLKNNKEKINVKNLQEKLKMSQNIVENYVKNNIEKESSEILSKTLMSSKDEESRSINDEASSSEILGKTMEMSSMNDESRSINNEASSSEIFRKTLEMNSMNDESRSINNTASSSEIFRKTLETSSMNDESRSINNTSSTTSVHPNYQLSISRNDKSTDHDKNFNNCKGGTKYQKDSLLNLFDPEEPMNDDDTDNSSKQIDQHDYNTSILCRDTEQYTSTSTSTVVKVKDQETQTLTFQDDSSKYEQFNKIKNGVNTMTYSDEILKCIDSIKSMRVKSERDFVPINDLTNLIAGDDFTW